ncbi:uncharacterized protein [Anabrus simplex]|uniref:uncharacterized protein n=1 Tax=Anabrus simplex TaxID=316456 RepID=UPI0035A39A9E
MKHIQELTICLLVFLNTVESRKLVMKEVMIPPVVDIRQNVTLTCRFDVGEERLYSVKWYKDGAEFYRFMPDNYPPCRSLPVVGITLLNDTRCNMENVTLTRLTFNSSGRYRCEISTEAPNFKTVYRISNMTVVALPLDDPMIEGVLSSYFIGDSVRASCISAKSNPPAQLAWFINGVEADGWQEERDTVSPIADEQGLYSTTLGLNFVTEKRYLNPYTREMELRCTSTVGNRTWSVAVTSTLNALTNMGLAQERFSNNVRPIISSSHIILIALVSALQRLASS